MWGGLGEELARGRELGFGAAATVRLGSGSVRSQLRGRPWRAFHSVRVCAECLPAEPSVATLSLPRTNPSANEYLAAAPAMRCQGYEADGFRVPPEWEKRVVTIMELGVNRGAAVRSVTCSTCSVVCFCAMVGLRVL
eukprot:SAG11_NODE_18796_length_481_cov_0.790576_1_plen_136_part_10